MIKWISGLYHRFYKVFWFGVTGVMNTALDYGIYVLLLATTKLPIEVCHACGYVAGIVCSFLMNRTVTFRAKGGDGVGQASRFLICNAAALVISTIMINQLNKYLNVSEYLIRIPVTVITAVINYFLYNFFVFRKKEKSGGAEDDR